MDQKKVAAGVTAIVPAYNESRRLSAVLSVLCSYDGFNEVIVVDDGSTDDTATVARTFPVRVVRNEKNRGKAHCMDQAAALADGDILFFCDADVTGLNHRIITDILTPVRDGSLDMFIGMRNRKIYALHAVMAFVPLLGGERAVRKSLWNSVPAEYKQRFQIEAALNFYAKYYGNGFRMRVFRGLRQTIKEKKYGVWSGLKQRAGMFVDVIRATVHLQIIRIPASVRNIRITLGALLTSLGITVVTTLAMSQMTQSPYYFFSRLFANELEQDPNAPIIHFILNVVSGLSVSTVLLFCVLIILSNAYLTVMATIRLVRLLKED